MLCSLVGCCLLCVGSKPAEGQSESTLQDVGVLGNKKVGGLLFVLL